MGTILPVYLFHPVLVAPTDSEFIIYLSIIIRGPPCYHVSVKFPYVYILYTDAHYLGCHLASGFLRLLRLVSPVYVFTQLYFTKRSVGSIH